MRRIGLVIALMTALVAGSALGQAQGGVSGDWEMRLHTQTGITTWQAQFEQAGDQLGGEIDLGDNEVLSVDGTVEGTTLLSLIHIRRCRRAI